MSEDDRPVVLSVEQALSMSYATLRFVHLGWRVIRVEPTPAARARDAGRSEPAHRPARSPAAIATATSSAPNVGKEAIALNLKEPEGRALLRRLVRELARRRLLHQHDARRGTPSSGSTTRRSQRVRARSRLVLHLGAWGSAYPDVPGYDPVLQALCGYMDLTGDPDGPADAVRPADHRPQGRRRGLRAGAARAVRAGAHGPGQAHRRLDGAGRGELAAHVLADARHGQPARRAAPLRQRAPAVHPDQRLPDRATASSTWPSAATCSGSASSSRAAVRARSRAPELRDQRGAARAGKVELHRGNRRGHAAAPDRRRRRGAGCARRSRTRRSRRSTR